jgi:hypothetical protein
MATSACGSRQGRGRGSDHIAWTEGSSVEGVRRGIAKKVEVPGGTERCQSINGEGAIVRPERVDVTRFDCQIVNGAI